MSSPPPGPGTPRPHGRALGGPAGPNGPGGAAPASPAGPSGPGGAAPAPPAPAGPDVGGPGPLATTDVGIAAPPTAAGPTGGLIEAHGLGYSIGGLVLLDGVDLVVPAGQSVAVTGPSGSGKTTLLYLLAGMVAPTTGTVTFDGRPVRGLVTPADGVATVLQGYGLVGLLTAVENVQLALRSAGVPAEEAGPAARTALADLGLAGHEDQLADELSGGQQQRTAVARALATRPRLLIADEPTAELDPASRALVLQRLLDVARSGGTVVIATHDPEVADACDRRLALGE